MKKKFIVEGMTCSACSAAVERAVKSIDGVKSASVNLISKILLCEYEEMLVSDDAIISAVEKAGYSAKRLIDAEENEPHQKSIGRAPSNVQNDILMPSEKSRLIVSLIITLILMYFSMGGMIGLPQPSFFSGSNNSALLMLFLAVLTLPVLYVNRKFFISGTKAVINRSPNMDTLVALGSGSAFIYGLFSLFMLCYGIGNGRADIVETYSGNLYFDSSAMILTLITVGKFLEEKSKSKTNGAIEKLKKLAPELATVCNGSGKTVEVAVKDLKVGDIILVKSGEGFPIDGVIIDGGAMVNEAALTGESMPVYKTVGDRVLSASANIDGLIKVKAEKVGKDTVLAEIIDLMLSTGATKAPIARFADKISAVFVPIVCSISLLTMIVWLILGQNFGFALSNAISVLVISCPCALGLATPVAITVATGLCAKNGILIKSAEAIERLKDIDIFVFDKTGTLTEGKPRVTDIYSVGDNAELLSVAYSLETGSAHPLAKAIIEYAEKEKVANLSASDFQTIAGRGIKALLRGESCIGGNAAFMRENLVDIAAYEKQAEAFHSEGKTVLFFAKSNKTLGIIAVADTLKKSSVEAVLELRKQNKQVIIISGDNRLVAQAVGKQLGIEADNVYSEVLPQDKSRLVSEIGRNGKVAFVGDGINDSPALTAADIGIAVGGGSDIAIEAGNIVLMKDDLRDIPRAVYYSKRTVRDIKQNLFWAFFYNAICIPLAAGAFYPLGIKLNPMIGAACMSLSSLFVVTNALRLRGAKIKNDTNNNSKEKANMKKTIHIEGMMCAHCAAHVLEALSKIEGVSNVEVSLENKLATFDATSEVTDKVIVEAIENAGYKMK